MTDQEIIVVQVREILSLRQKLEKLEEDFLENEEALLAADQYLNDISAYINWKGHRAHLLDAIKSAKGITSS